jgi:uncharacterized protein YukE
MTTESMGEKRSLETEIKLTFTDAVKGAQSLASYLEAMSTAMGKIEGGLNLKAFKEDVDKLIGTLEGKKGLIKYDYFKEQLTDQINEALVKSSIHFDHTFNTQPFKVTMPTELFKEINSKIQTKLEEALKDHAKLGLNNLEFKFYFNAKAMDNFRKAFNTKLNEQIEKNISIASEAFTMDENGKEVRSPIKLTIDGAAYRNILKKIGDKVVETLSNPDAIKVENVDGMLSIKAMGLANVITKVSKEIKKVDELFASLADDPKFKQLSDYRLNLGKFRDTMTNLYDEVSVVASALNNIDVQDKGSQGKKVSELDRMIRTLRDSVTGKIGALIKDITASVSVTKDSPVYNQYAEWLKTAADMVQKYIKDTIDDSLLQLYKDLGYSPAVINGKTIMQKGMGEVSQRIEQSTLEAVRQVASEISGGAFLTADDASRIAQQIGIHTEQTKSRIEQNTQLFAKNLMEDILKLQTDIFTDLQGAVTALIKKYAAEVPSLASRPVRVDASALIAKLNALTGGAADIPDEKLDEVAQGVKNYLSNHIANVVDTLNSQQGRALNKNELDDIDEVMYAQSKKLVDFTIKKSTDVLEAFTNGLSDKNFKSFTTAEKKVIQDSMKDTLKNAVAQMTQTVQAAFSSVALRFESAKELEQDVEAALGRAVENANVTGAGVISLDLTDSVNRAIARAGAKIADVVDSWLPADAGAIDINYRQHVLEPLQDHVNQLTETIRANILALTEALTSTGIVNSSDVSPINTAVQGYLSRYVGHLAIAINNMNAAQAQGRFNLNSVMGGLTLGANGFLTNYTDRLIEDAHRVSQELGSSFRANTADLPQHIRRILATRGNYRTLREYQRAVPVQEGDEALRNVLNASLESTMTHMNDRFLQALTTQITGIRSAIDGQNIHFNPIHGDSLLQSITGDMNRVMEEVVAKLRRELDAQFRLIFQGIRDIDVVHQSLGYTPPAGTVRGGRGSRRAARGATGEESSNGGQYGDQGFLFGDRMPLAVRGNARLPKDFMYEDALTRSAMITVERTKNRFRGSTMAQEDHNNLNDYLDNTYLPRMRELAGRATTSADYRLVAPMIKQTNQELQYLVEQFRESKRTGTVAFKGGEMEKNLAEFMQRTQIRAEGLRTKFLGKLGAEDYNEMDEMLNRIISKSKDLAAMEVVDLQSLATAGRLMRQFAMELETVSKGFDRVARVNQLDNRSSYAMQRDQTRADSFDIELQRVRDSFRSKLGEQDYTDLNQRLDALQQRSTVLAGTPIGDDTDIRRRTLEIADLRNELARVRVLYNQMASSDAKGDLFGQDDMLKGDVTLRELESIMQTMTHMQVKLDQFDAATRKWKATLTDVNGETQKIEGNIDRISGELFVGKFGGVRSPKQDSLGYRYSPFVVEDYQNNVRPVRQGERRNGLTDAMMNSARYTVAGSLIGAPSIAMWYGYDQYKQFEYNMLKAQQNFMFKDLQAISDPNGDPMNVMQSTAAERLQQRTMLDKDFYYAQGDAGRKFYDQNVLTKEQLDANYEQLLGQEQADLRAKAYGGNRRTLQQLAYVNGVSTTDAATAYHISSRRWDDPNEAMAFTRQILKAKSIEDVDVEAVAMGFEALASQWGLVGAEMEKVTNMIIKSTNMTQAKIEDVLDTQARAGAIFRDVMPEVYAEDKFKAIAQATALSTMFVQGTARSGKEGGTFYKSILEHLYKPESVSILEELSELPQFAGMKLSPFVTDPDTGVKRQRDILELMGAVFDAVGVVGKPDRNQIFEPLAQTWQIGGAAALVALVEDSQRAMEQQRQAIEVLNERRLSNNQKQIQGSGVNGAITSEDVFKFMSGEISDISPREIALIQAAQMGTYQFKENQVKTMWEVATGDVFESLQEEFSRLATYLNAFLRVVGDNAQEIATSLQLATTLGMGFGARWLLGKGMDKVQDKRDAWRGERVDRVRTTMNSQAHSINVRRRFFESQLDNAFARGGDPELTRVSQRIAPQMAALAAEAHMLNNRMKLLDNEVARLGISEDKLSVKTNMVQTEFKNATVDATAFSAALKKLATQAGVDVKEFDRLQRKIDQLEKGHRRGKISTENYHKTMARLGRQFDAAGAGVPAIVNGSKVSGGAAMVAMIAAASSGAGQLTAGGGTGGGTFRQLLTGLLQGRGAPLRDANGKLERDDQGNVLFEQDVDPDRKRYSGARRVGRAVGSGLTRVGAAASIGVGLQATIGRAGRNIASEGEIAEMDAMAAQDILKQFYAASSDKKSTGDKLLGWLGYGYNALMNKLQGGEGYDMAQRASNGGALSRDAALANIYKEIAAARVKMQEEIYKADPTKAFLVDTEGNIKDTRYENVTTIDEAQQLIGKINEDANNKLNANESAFQIRQADLMVKGFRDDSEEIIKITNDFLESQRKLLTAAADQIKKEKDEVEKAGQKDSPAWRALDAEEQAKRAQAAQMSAQIVGNRLGVKTNATTELFDDLDFSLNKASIASSGSVSDLLIGGATSDSASVKGATRAGLLEQNRIIAQSLPKLQAELSKYNPNLDSEREQYRDIWLRIAQLQQEQKDNLVKIKESLTKMSTFNLPDGMQPMTYFEAMSSGSQFKNVTTRVGDVIVNVTLGADMTADEADKIGKSIAGHVQKGQRQQAQELGNQVRAGYQGNYNSMIGGK